MSKCMTIKRLAYFFFGVFIFVAALASFAGTSFLATLFVLAKVVTAGFGIFCGIAFMMSGLFGE